MPETERPITAMTAPKESPKILVIRRENIGDLVCTTPLIHALRCRFPKAYIACLVNTYNIQVLELNPDVDAVYAYTKPRHRRLRKSAMHDWFSVLQLYFTLLTKRFDYVVLATVHYLQKDINLIRALHPRHIIAIASENNPVDYVDIPVELSSSSAQMHIVEELAKLAEPFGITPPPPRMQVFPDPELVAKIRFMLVQAGIDCERPIVGLHVSSRNPLQRWPTSHFIELIQRLNSQSPTGFVIFWSPGDEDNPYHPGDDRKVAEILRAIDGIPVFGYPTHSLRELIAGMSVCSSIICSDGGAMHIAAALAKPIVCFFGPASAERWRPWQVANVLLQTESKRVEDISVEMAIAAHNQLMEEVSSDAS